MGRSKSYLHRGGETPLLGVTIPEHFATVVERFTDYEAIVCVHQDRRVTYHQFSQQIDRVACGLVGLGFSKGDRIGVWSTNNVEWLLLQMATARIGVILVNINPANRPRELAHALKQAEIQGLFSIPCFRRSNYVEMLADLLPCLKSKEQVIKEKAFPHLRRVVLYDPAAPDDTRTPHPGFTAWQSMLEAGQDVSVATLDTITSGLNIDDPINIQFTSGTTGFPKAVVLSHHNILNNALFTAEAMGFTSSDRLCIPVPFYHCFGMVLSNLLCFSVGACLVIPSEHFDPLQVLKSVSAERCTGLHGVPTMFIAELNHPDFTSYDMSSLRTGIMAGAPCPPELMRDVMTTMNCREILIGYGQTEASPITHLTAADDSIERRTKTVGRNLPHQEVKVISTDDGSTVPLNEIGEICFRGYHIMRGYYGQPDATADAIDHSGWLHSGDLGTMDEDGFVRITGRLKEMIIRGGENIYPAEIEACLFEHPKIVQTAVFGVPDELMGEEIVAWVQLRPGEALTEIDVREHCKSGLAHFKVPRDIRFVDEFPTTVTGKLQKFRMREIELDRPNLATQSARVENAPTV
jgi:fatty-acyl-CoA synthase